ncbi:MAG: amidase family protein, partial [Gammaproteobacteria bacterium]|nr:amidase family protein [Gammaproteobacteria bacterium]
MANEELTRGTIADLAERLRKGQVSPVDATTAHLARIERLNGSLKAYLNIMPERAMAAARRAETEIRNGRYRGPLHGVPVAVKDLF